MRAPIVMRSIELRAGKPVVEHVDAERKGARAARIDQPGAAILLDRPPARRRRLRQIAVGERGKGQNEKSGESAEARPPEQTHAAVPPTVSPSIRSVG